MSKTASRFTESQEAALVPWYSCISFSKEKRRNCSSTVDAIQSVEQPGMGRGYKCRIFEKVKSPYRVNFFEAKRDLCRGIPRLPTTWTKTEDSVGNLSCIFELFKPKIKLCKGPPVQVVIDEDKQVFLYYILIFCNLKTKCYFTLQR